MNITKSDILLIFKKLEEQLKDISPHYNNNNALIQISADYKEIKEVIQYFESAIDSLNTQNESLKDIFKDTLKDLCDANIKIIEGSISKDEFHKIMVEIEKKADKELASTKTPQNKKIKNYINDFITPKIIIVFIGIIIIGILLIIRPKVTEKVIHDIVPISKDIKKHL